MHPSSNFTFLKAEWPELYKLAVKVERFANTDPRTALIYGRMALETAVNWMYQHDTELEMPIDKSLSSLMKTFEFRAQLSAKLYQELDIIRKAGNLAAHNRPVTATDAESVAGYLFYFCRWFAKSYASTEIGVLAPFDSSLIPTEGDEALSKKKIDELQVKFAKTIGKVHDEIAEANEKNRLLESENELYRLQLQELRAKQEANKRQANSTDDIYHPRNEIETRKLLIDVLLREAGWDLSSINNREYMVNNMPVSDNPSGIGYIDYVLWDDDGLPLAVVEAKKTMVNAKNGENQAQLYAECLEKTFGRRPVMFYTNGYEIYIWDDQFYKQSRPINGFYTKRELQTIMFRRAKRKDIRTSAIDAEIAGRPYQMRSIKSIAEHFAGTDKRTGNLVGTNRGALLVLATGTGKTRTAIALCKLLFEANWAKRVLFLADRISLVKQAKNNFVKHLPDYSCVNLLEDKENTDTRLAFSTYATMMGLIDSAKSDSERYYGVGHFDLVIIDEAHRSIYRKYQALFDYFDALFLGLTATPKNSIDKNTYQIFGLADKTPTDAYTFDEAVANGHLVPYHTVEVPTKFLTQGIKYSELSAEEQEQFEKEILDGEEASGNEWIESSALNDWLFNKDTAIKTLSFILKHGIKKRGGDELGKTIIFARNRKHAEFLKDIFMQLDKELFSNDYVKVIDHSQPKAQSFIERFCDEEKERLPQIVISVDMMDTGIDAPSVVNLVFYKPVKSYTKFWQMIGRGSRLRPNLFGPGIHKDKFLIFDLCGNFQFFAENEHGIETSVQKSVTEQVFSLRLELAEYLRSDHLSTNTELMAFRQSLLDGLFNEISSLNRDRFDVRMKIKTVNKYAAGNRELWNHLEKKDIQVINETLAPLVKPAKGDTDLSRYYDKLLYSIMAKRLETPNTSAFKSKSDSLISSVSHISKKLLEKTTIPEVKHKEKHIRQPLDAEFWDANQLAHLEELRCNVRNLLRYIDAEDVRYVMTDFEDSLNVEEIVEKSYAVSVETTPCFSSNRQRLEKIIRDNSSNITIKRIRDGETITHQELASLEKMLFDGQIKKEELEKEIGKTLNLVEMVLNLTGQSEKHVDEAFADFINTNQLSSQQIDFLNTIKVFLTTNGKIDPAKLYEPPFISFHNQGVDGVFNNDQSDKIFHIINNLNNIEKIIS